MPHLTQVTFKILFSVVSKFPHDTEIIGIRLNWSSVKHTFNCQLLTVNKTKLLDVVVMLSQPVGCHHGYIYTGLSWQYHNTFSHGIFDTNIMTGLIEIPGMDPVFMAFSFYRRHRWEHPYFALVPGRWNLILPRSWKKNDSPKMQNFPRNLLKIGKISP